MPDTVVLCLHWYPISTNNDNVPLTSLLGSHMFLETSGNSSSSGNPANFLCSLQI